MYSHGRVLEMHIFSSVSDRSSHEIFFTDTLRGSVILDSFHLGRFESCVHLTFTFFDERNELNVDLTSASNVSDSHLINLDSGFATLYNNIASDIRVTLLPRNKNTVMTTSSEFISPHTGCTLGRLIKPLNINSIFVRLVNQVVDQSGLVVQYVDTCFA